MFTESYRLSIALTKDKNFVFYLYKPAKFSHDIASVFKDFVKYIPQPASHGRLTLAIHSFHGTTWYAGSSIQEPLIHVTDEY